MTLKKTIEFPLFHVGQFTAMDGAKVPITEALLRQAEKNSNFILKSRILQAPIGYDHPAKSSDAHGTLVGTRYHNGVLYAQGSDWSDTLVADVKAMKKLAYSGELDPNFTYPDGTGKMVALGPAVVGMAILGSRRPAIKNLKPLSDFEFSEGTSPADAFETREELRSAGLVSQHVDGQHFFGEVENDATRFFSETRTEEQTPMTEAEKQEMQNAINAGIAAAVAPLKQANEDLKSQIQNFSEESKRVAKVDGLVDKLKKEKPIGQIALDAYRVALLDPSEANVQAFAEKLPAFIAPGGIAGKTKEKPGNGDGGEADDDGEEPKALAAIRPKHFAEIDDPRNQQLIDNALTAFAEFKPEALKGVEQNPLAQMERLRTYVTQRDTGSASN